MIGTNFDRLVERRKELQDRLGEVNRQIDVVKHQPNPADALVVQLQHNPAVAWKLAEAKKRQSLLGKVNGARIHALNKEREALGRASSALGRLISKMERPVVVPNGVKVPDRWFAKPEELAGPARKPRQPKEQKPTGKMKASQRKQLEVARGR